MATQQQKTEAIKKETESLKAVADAERHKAVLEIDIQKQVKIQNTCSSKRPRFEGFFLDFAKEGRPRSVIARERHRQEEGGEQGRRGRVQEEQRGGSQQRPLHQGVCAARDGQVAVQQYQILLLRRDKRLGRFAQ